jgi:hypothetical protein
MVDGDTIRRDAAAKALYEATELITPRDMAWESLTEWHRDIFRRRVDVVLAAHSGGTEGSDA